MRDFHSLRRVLALVESANDPEAWGDSGRACGRYQMHPGFYVSWGPTILEFGGRELSWDEAFEIALSRFLEACERDRPTATDEQIAMAFHLHGQPRWDGWDDGYSQRWRAIAARELPKA